ncbi:MAG: asparagine synthase (glutamine-hydrolyzing) [Opitutaceae bacterium]
MCGIVGHFSTRVSPADRSRIVERMCAALLHRGPDDGGVITKGPITLGIRRLAVIDPENGHQPWQSDDARFTLVFNGAILNFRELRAELEELGRSFRTDSDTEVLLAAFIHWGEACLPRLRGMFAFAVWDDHLQQLFLARDAFGIKPLYLRASPSGTDLWFASEIRALQQACDDFTLDPQALCDTLAFLAVPAPRTLYREVLSLRPGEYARWKQGRLERVRSWDFSKRARTDPACRDATAFVTELRARLEDTVRVHLIADVPVGVFLSGGLDSALLAGLAARKVTRPLQTFSVGFAEAGYSETEQAAATARHLGCDHHTTVVTGNRVVDDLDRLLDAMDQPTGDALNTYYASELAARGGVKVVLSGLGADELFGSYPSFRQIPQLQRYQSLWRWVPRSLRRGVTGLTAGRSTRTQKMADVFAYANDRHDLAACSRRVWSTRSLRRLADGRVSAALHPGLAEMRASLNDADTFETISAWELQTYMSDVLLRDSDVMSMRHSLELRVPFADRPLVEWLWSQPSAWRNTPAQPKSALAAAGADVLPPGLAGRPKWGFTLPMNAWMRAELRPFLEDTFTAASVGQSGFFSVKEVQAQWQHFLRRDDARGWSRLWSLAVTIAFLNRRRSR